MSQNVFIPFNLAEFKQKSVFDASSLLYIEIVGIACIQWESLIPGNDRIACVDRAMQVNVINTVLIEHNRHSNKLTCVSHALAHVSFRKG